MWKMKLFIKNTTNLPKLFEVLTSEITCDNKVSMIPSDLMFDMLKGISEKFNDFHIIRQVNTSYNTSGDAHENHFLYCGTNYPQIRGSVKNYLTLLDKLNSCGVCIQLSHEDENAYLLDKINNYDPLNDTFNISVKPFLFKTSEEVR